MEIIWWSLVLICFFGSFIALVKPILPGVPLLWGGFLIYHFLINGNELNSWFWIFQILFTLFIFGVDILANRFFLRKQGGTKHTEKVGMLSIIIGAFVLPPFGLIIVPFIAVFVSEVSQNKTTQQAAKVAFATVISFLASTIAKLVVQVIMVILFLGWIL